MQESDLRLKKIAEALGYADVSSFTRKLNLTVGMTPGEYRKTYADGTDSAAPVAPAAAQKEITV